jgi:DNA-directed RNA polymerase subunit M/transcription elongation factor TFIIS
MRVYILEKDGKVQLLNAKTHEVVAEFSDVSEAVKYALDNNYQLPLRAVDGEFVVDKKGNPVYIDEKGILELADGTLLEGCRICPKCGWIAYWEEVLDEDKEPRECYVCPHCGYVFECTPEPEDIGAGD